MPEPRSDSRRRSGRARERKLPSPAEWERAETLEPVPAPRDPGLISDGGGLAFPAAALIAAPEPLDPADPAVAALVAKLAARTGKGSFRAPWRRPKPAPASDPPKLEGWRALARTDDEVLFGHGRPPQLVTVAVRSDGRRWSCIGVSSARPLRAARAGVRASSWRLDPTWEPSPDDRLVRLLVTEQSVAGGLRADGRLQTPELHVDSEQLILRVFVTPRSGFQTRGPNPETPARLTLPEPLGSRRLVDGAVVWAPAPAEPEAAG